MRRILVGGGASRAPGLGDRIARPRRIAGHRGTGRPERPVSHPRECGGHRSGRASARRRRSHVWWVPRPTGRWNGTIAANSRGARPYWPAGSRRSAISGCRRRLMAISPAWTVRATPALTVAGKATAPSWSAGTTAAGTVRQSAPPRRPTSPSGTRNATVSAYAPGWPEAEP